jgi:hypothetical protein
MPVAVGVGGLLVSAYSAHQAGQKADQAQRLQQSAIQNDQAFRQQQLDQWNAQYGPIQNALVKQASSEQPLNLGPTWANIQSNFDQGGRNNEARLSHSGMLGSSIDKNSTLENGRVLSLSDAFSKGLQSRDALRERLLQASKQMPGQVGFVSQGNENLSNLYGQQLGMYGQAAGNAWQGFGNALTGLGYTLGNRPLNQNPEISPYLDPSQPHVSTNMGASPIQNYTPPQDYVSPYLPPSGPSFDASAFDLTPGKTKY